MVDKNDAREWLKEYFRMQTIVGIPQNFETIVDALTAYAAAVTQEREALRPNDDELECMAIEVEKKGASDPQILHIGIFCALRDLRDKLYARTAAEESQPK